MNRKGFTLIEAIITVIVIIALILGIIICNKGKKKEEVAPVIKKTEAELKEEKRVFYSANDSKEEESCHSCAEGLYMSYTFWETDTSAEESEGKKYLKEAIDYCQRARELDSNDIRPPARLACYYYLLDDLKRARKWMKIQEKLEKYLLEQRKIVHRYYYDYLFAQGRELAHRMRMYAYLEKEERSLYVAVEYLESVPYEREVKWNLKGHFLAHDILFCKYADNFYKDKEKVIYGFLNDKAEEHAEKTYRTLDDLEKHVPEKKKLALKIRRLLDKNVREYRQEKERRKKKAVRQWKQKEKEREAALSDVEPSEWQGFFGPVRKQSSLDNYAKKHWQGVKKREEKRTGWIFHYLLTQTVVEGRIGYIKGMYWYTDRFGDRKPSGWVHYKFKEKYRANYNKWTRIGYIEGPTFTKH